MRCNFEEKSIYLAYKNFKHSTSNMSFVDMHFRKIGDIFSNILQKDKYDLTALEDDPRADKRRNSDLSDSISLHGRVALDLSMRELRSVPVFIFNGNRAQILRLNGNYLRTLPFELAKMTNLEELYLQNNNLQFLPAQACALVNLQVLDLSYNNINSLPFSVSHMRNLRVLDLAYNGIDTLPESMMYMERLELLNLDGNGMQKVPVAVMRLDSLIVLKMRDNELTTLPKDMMRLKKLKELYFTRNKITKIADNLRPFLQKLHVLALDDILEKATCRGENSIANAKLLSCLTGGQEKETKSPSVRKKSSIAQFTPREYSADLTEYSDDDEVYEPISSAFYDFSENTMREKTTTL